jgi:P22_AR N-terminal domain/ORF6C domain
MSDELTNEQQIEVSITKVVDFYGDQIPAAQGADGEVYVPIRPLFDFLGLNRVGQVQRIKRDPVLSKRTRTLRIDTGGGLQNLMCLPLDLLPGWLFGISQSRVGTDLQDKLNRYREECFRVLWNAFKSDILPAAPLPTNLTIAEQTLAQAEAVYHLAQQQVELERRHNVMADYMRGFVRDTKSKLGEHDQRISALEMRLDPASAITEEQAADLAIAVKTLAYELEERGKVGTYQSGYARVYSEMYRRYEIKTYKNLRRDRYDVAMNWLRQWYDEVTKEGKPTED